MNFYNLTCHSCETVDESGFTCQEPMDNKFQLTLESGTDESDNTSYRYIIIWQCPECKDVQVTEG